MTYKIKLTKIGIVDDPYVPIHEQYAKEGEERILMVSGKPHVDHWLSGSYVDRFRGFHTSVIKEIVSETETEIIFKTMNSVYKFEILETIDPTQN